MSERVNNEAATTYSQSSSSVVAHLALDLLDSRARVKDLEEERDEARSALVELANEENARCQEPYGFDRGGQRVRAAIARVRALQGGGEMSDPINVLIERNRALDRAERAEARVKELEMERLLAETWVDAARAAGEER
jgi:ABC-type microcin C transport system duplicated ATPase subunit YejF